MSTFKDNFSTQSVIYARYRPSYPDALFKYLSDLSPEHDRAWDCATGNGQAAHSLTAFYKHVYASDASAGQLNKTKPHERITFKVENAESTGLSNASVDLVTVAQALHWFKFEAFYAEVKRVLKPGGIIAVWAYGLPNIEPGVDEIIRNFHDERVGEFWLPENRLIETEYRDIPFPFETIITPNFEIQKQLGLDDVTGLLQTWSATQKYITKYGTDPTGLIRDALQTQWGQEASVKTATWKLILKVGKHHGR